MKLLVGLGNPGKGFLRNRHNIGHVFVDFLASQGRAPRALRAWKTDCLMNESGKFVARVRANDRVGPCQVCIVHDDLDLPLGSYKIQFGKGPQLHYGVQSVEKELGTKDFWRIRIGIDNRDPNNRVSGDEYVLQDFTEEEIQVLEDEVFPKIWGELQIKLKS